MKYETLKRACGAFTFGPGETLELDDETAKPLLDGKAIRPLETKPVSKSVESVIVEPPKPDKPTKTRTSRKTTKGTR